MIRAEALEFRYGNKQPIFQDFHWYAARGQAWAVIGASGCGKSTLLSGGCAPAHRVDFAGLRSAAVGNHP